MTAVSETEASSKRVNLRSLPPLALVPLAALVWWVVGFLPWLLDGATLDAPPENEVSAVALPLYAGGLSTLVLGAGVGGIAAGLTSLLASGARVVRAAACAAGVALALVITLVQSRSGMSDEISDDRVVNGLTVIVVIMTVAGFGVGLLCLTGRVGLGFALAALAGAAPVWLVKVLAALGVSSMDTVQSADELSRWVGAAVLAAALVVIGLRPPVRAVAWIGAVLLAWCIAPTITAAGYAEVFIRPGLGGFWGDHFSATMEVWQQAASVDMRPLTPWLVAIAVAAVISLWIVTRSRQQEDAEPEPSAGP